MIIVTNTFSVEMPIVWLDSVFYFGLLYYEEPGRLGIDMSAVPLGYYTLVQVHMVHFYLEALLHGPGWRLTE